MSERCKICGLEKEFCTCAEVEREQTQGSVQISTEKTKFNKLVTKISGIVGDIPAMAKELKQKYGCGGNVENNIIKLQGNHKIKVKAYLESKGYAVSA